MKGRLLSVQLDEILTQAYTCVNYPGQDQDGKHSHPKRYLVASPSLTVPIPYPE